jgi:hypothetical protein
VEALVKYRNGNNAFGIGLVDSTERVQDFGAQGNVMSPWQASPLEERVVGVVVCHTSQFRMGKIKVVKRDQRHGKIERRRDQFVP